MLTRKLLFCLTSLWLFVGAGFISAQSNPERELELQLLDAFSTLDMTEVKTGILYNRVPEYVSLYMLDGRRLPDSIAMDGKSFTLAYGMLNWAHLNRNALPPPDTFINRVRRWQNADQVILGGLYFRYNKFRDDIIGRDMIVADTVNKKFMRGSNQSESPYTEDTLFSFTCMKNTSNSLSQIFRLEADAFFTNIEGGFSSAEIDFGDGRGYVPVTLGNEMQIDYREYGKYYIKLRLRDDQDRYLFAHSYIQIEPKISDISLRDYGAPVLLHTNENVEVWSFINDNCNNKQIRKPLILIDGFDIGDNYNAERIQYLLKVSELDAALNPEDYDIFYLNFIDATIDIFENGAYVRKAIEWINEQKALAESDEKNVVIGFSMGAPVGKVALRSMELDGVDHETEMYFTYDGVMKGANIPMGLQCLLMHIAEYHVAGVQLQNWIPELGDAVDILNSPAAKQMLYYHESNANWVDDNIFLDSKYTEASALKSSHDEFYQQFEALGQLSIPQLAVSNGAIIDGNISDLGQGFLPDEVILNQHLDISSLIGGFWGALAEFYYLNNGTYFNADFLVRALPEGDGTFYVGYLHLEFLFLGGLGDYKIRKVLNAKPYDSCPGGSRSFKIDKFPLNWKAKAFSFVPTISSLGLDDINNNIHPYYSGNLEIPSNVLPNTFYADYVGSTTIKNSYEEFPEFSNINEQHVFMSPPIISFLQSYLVGKDYLLEEVSSLGNVIENRNYNFGKPEVNGYFEPFRMSNIIDFDLNINNNGKLWVNRAGKLAFSDLPPNLINSYPQEYRTIIKGAECESVPVTVNVNTRGEINISDQSISNKGILEIWHNATLNINQGGLLKLENKSEILVKSGGKLRLNDLATL